MKRKTLNVIILYTGIRNYNNLKNITSSINYANNKSEEFVCAG